ncbi:hypothetical protein H5410_015507 [Solanum commersonii]|uniref:Uncharacterized protein n=1 Tax=Solanum commersonii TaxID=4109 RepID=A0A9J5ZUA8_SOLCO|nr:hypothetical protein H5410_015507 [Solanum commersonii]
MASHGHSLRRRCQNRRDVRYRMSVRVSKIISHLHYIINDNGRVCIDRLRMDKNAFHTLVLLTKDIGGLTNSKTHHEKNRSIKVDYIRSRWSVSQAFNECLNAILKLTPLLLVNPKPVLEDNNIIYLKGLFRCTRRNLNFTYVLPRWEGSAADGHVLRDAIVTIICVTEDIRMKNDFFHLIEVIAIG